MDASYLQSLLRERPVVADGGMGSLIYQTLGYPPALCIEHTPLTHPETVLQIHLGYIAAGAELIQAHSYGANRVRLAPYGLAEKAVAINSQAVKLAREAKEISGKDVLIAPEESTEAVEEFRNMVEENPVEYVAQSPVDFSTNVLCSVEDGEITLRDSYADYRIHGIAPDPETVEVIPGAMTRVAAPGSRLVNVSSGGVTKDTWVLG
jgi:hypothetical protein